MLKRFNPDDLSEKARVLDSRRRDVPLKIIMPVLKEYDGSVGRFGEVEEAQEKSPGSNVFILDRGKVYALKVPEEKLPEVMRTEAKSPAWTAFDDSYRIVRVPKNPETQALIGWQTGVCAFEIAGEWMRFFRDRLMEADRGDYSNFDLGGDGEGAVKKALTPFFGKKSTERLYGMPRIDPRSVDTSLQINRNALVFQTARDVVRELLTDREALQNVLQEFREINSFWHGSGMEDVVLPPRVTYVSIALADTGTGDSITHDMEKIRATLESAGIPYIRYDIKTADTRWPKDMRVWSHDNTFCVEPLSYGGKEMSYLDQSSAWKTKMSTRVMLSKGGSVIHGAGATPFMIVAEGADQLEVDGFLEAVREIPGHEDTRVYVFRPGFVKWRKFGTPIYCQSPDLDMNLDAFNAEDTMHRKPGIWIDPIYRRALERTSEFQRFMQEQGEAIVVVESDPSETHLHPQNTSKITLTTRLVNNCPKSLATLKPAEGRYLVLIEPIEDLFMLDGGPGCNTSMVLMSRV